jgi:hypothetical protein
MPKKNTAKKKRFTFSPFHIYFCGAPVPKKTTKKKKFTFSPFAQNHITTQSFAALLRSDAIFERDGT